MVVLEIIKEYCKIIDDCGNCKYNSEKTVGCPFAKAPKHWEEDLMKKVNDSIKIDLKLDGGAFADAFLNLKKEEKEDGNTQ